jgi:hypothetical protein
VQVILDCAWTDEHLRGDFCVGAPLGHKLRDSRLLWRQALARVKGLFARALPRGAQFDARPLGKTPAAKIHECLMGSAQLIACISRSALAPQPFTEEKTGSGKVQAQFSGDKLVDGAPEQRLSLRALTE